MNFDEAWDDTASVVAKACRVGDSAAVKRLLSEGRPIDVKDNRGWTALHDAAHGGQLTCASLIVADERCCIDALTNDGASALVLAARRGHEDVCRLLIDRGASYECNDYSPLCPLRAAVINKSLACVQLLVHAGCRLDCKDKDYSTPLHLALECSQKAIVQHLLMHGAAIDEQDGFGRTAVFIAAEFGPEDSLRRILNFARSRGILKKVLEMKDFKTATTPLMIAAQNGSHERVSLLINAGADPNTISCDYTMALHLSILSNNVRCVETLLYYTDFEVLRSVTWQTDCRLVLSQSQQCACWACHSGFGRGYRHRNFNVSKLRSVFHMAVYAKDDNVLRCLVNNKLDPNESLALDDDAGKWMPDDERRRYKYVGTTALALAMARSDSAKVHILLDGGCRPTPEVAHVMPPLYSAVRVGWLQGIKTLLDRGADANVALECSFPRLVTLQMDSQMADRDEERLLLMLRQAGGDVRRMFAPKRRSSSLEFLKSDLLKKMMRCTRRDDGLDLVSQLLHSMGSTRLYRELEQCGYQAFGKRILKTYPQLTTLQQMSAVVIRNRILDARPSSAFAASVASLNLPPSFKDYLALKSLKLPSRR